MGVAMVHRGLAGLLGLFIAAHMAVHGAALWSAEAHIAAQKAIEDVYRSPFVEPVLAATILTQVILGIRLFRRRWAEPGKGFWGWLQLASGGYLAFFLLAHTTAALVTRHLVGLETNFYWAAGTATLEPFLYTFRPYYALAIFTVFAHAACAWRFASRGVYVPWALVTVGAFFSITVVAAVSGALYPIDLPQAYADYFGAFQSQLGWGK